jgi:predicted nucleotidyltransferase
VTLARDHVVGTLGRALRWHPEVDLCLLFGSIARDRAGAESDVDLAVKGRAADTLGLAAELGTTLGAEVDVVCLDDDLPIALLGELLRDSICIYEGKPGANASFRSRAMWTLETDGPLIERMNRAWLARLANGSAR